METRTSKQYYDQSYGLDAPQNYERFFVPVIGKPVAEDLLKFAGLRPEDRILDVACGTGIVARLIAEKVNPDPAIIGLDINSGMIEVAKSITPPEAPVEYMEASAEEIPLEKESVDVVICQMGLQFMENKSKALQEMYRVLTPGGRLIFNVPGPAGPIWRIFDEALERHVGDSAAGFVRNVFLLDDTEEMKKLMTGPGFREIITHDYFKLLHLPEPKDFLWQYVYSTPLAAMLSDCNEDVWKNLEREVVEKWQDFVEDGVFRYEQRMVEVSGKKQGQFGN